jgi:peptide/nickel transport system permease protein
MAEVIAIIVGLAVGAYAGWRRGGRTDRIGSGISLILYSMPYFVIGMPLIIIFASGLHWFPTSGMTTPGGDKGPVEALFDLGRHLVRR